jgi:lysozyme family protein
VGRWKVKTNFDKVMSFILEIEGGYVNDSDDPGGETKYGISKRSHSNVDIGNLTEDAARKIYKEEYWDKIKGDDLPSPMDMAVMDTAVNMGIGAALDLLQANRDYRDYLFARVDRYLKIVAKNATLQKFFKGWIIRVVRLFKLCRG